MPREGLRSRKAPATGDAAAGGAGDSGTVSMDKLKEMAAAGRVTMVVEDEAYDFTDFIKDHPGGPEYVSPTI